MLLNLTRPVDHYRKRTYDHKTALALFFKMRHNGNGLYGLSKAHLIAQKRVFAVYDEFGSEFLIFTQMSFHQRRSEFQRIYGFKDLFRRAACGIFFLGQHRIGRYDRSCALFNFGLAHSILRRSVFFESAAQSPYTLRCGVPHLSYLLGKIHIISS